MAGEKLVTPPVGSKEENRGQGEQRRSQRSFGDLLGQSEGMQNIIKLIQKIAASPFPVVITGESGTGKEFLARSIHEAGPRRDKPFVQVDSAAVIPTLMEGELFGCLSGTFTDAVANRMGLFEAAEGGTLFLDDVTELPVGLQARLLRAIEQKEFKPIGGSEPISFNARIIASTSRNIETAVRQGSFRQDLYFRLNVITITLPPLRKRREDIPLLAKQILQRFPNLVTGTQEHVPWTLSLEAQNLLLACSWPGNVRELESCLQFAVTFGSGPVIQAADLPSWVQSAKLEMMADFPEDVISLEELERMAIRRALARSGGDKVLAARQLGIGKTTLYRKLHKYRQEQ